MVDLQTVQNNFLEAIFKKENDQNFFKYIKEYSGASSIERFLVHKQTILENFINALRITYPGIWALIGEACAAGACMAYIHQLDNLPRASSLESFGQHFPEFLGNFASTKKLGYLPDFARLEWTRNLSYNAININSLGREDLTSIPLENFEQAIFTFNPSVFFLTSVFPLNQIQELLDNPESREINLSNEPSFILICRVNGRVVSVWFKKEDWLFLKTLGEGVALGKVIDDYKNITPEKITELLSRLIDYRLVQAIRINHSKIT